MAAFALAIFTGAFLLFLVQPLIAKFILPWFGGTPAVWSTCMLFFQLLLLGGYAYAHWSIRSLKPRRQVIVHLTLLLVSLVLIPIVPNEALKPVDGDNPAGRILLLLLATIGLPYFALSATGPLFQAWFAEAQPGKSPYRLYALSNIGSLLALVAMHLWSDVDRGGASLADFRQDLTDVLITVHAGTENVLQLERLRFRRIGKSSRHDSTSDCHGTGSTKRTTCQQ